MSNIYLIKDLAKLSGHTIHTVKYYLNIGLIEEVGRSPETNYRYFDNKILERLNKIREFRRQKKSINEIKEILDNK